MHIHINFEKTIMDFLFFISTFTIGVLVSIYTILRMVVHTLLLCTPTTKGELGEYKITVAQHGWTAYKLRFNTKDKLFWVIPLWWYGAKFGGYQNCTWVEEKMTPEELEKWKQKSLTEYEAHIKLWSK